MATRRAIPDEAAAITVPTLILVGELDGLTPLEQARELEELIGGARLAVVPASGHHTPIEQPDAVTRLIAGLLDEVGPFPA